MVFGAGAVNALPTVIVKVFPFKVTDIFSPTVFRVSFAHADSLVFTVTFSQALCLLPFTLLTAIVYLVLGFR